MTCFFQNWRSGNLCNSEDPELCPNLLALQDREATCLSKGTGSAFKDGGLQGDGLRAVLATAMVFGRAEARLKMEGCREMVSKLCWLLQWSSAAPAARPRPR